MDCATVDGVQLPTRVTTAATGAGLKGALPPSLGDLGPSLTSLDLDSNAITSLPTEIGALTNLAILDLSFNALTSVPTEVGALAGLTYLDLPYNAITSVPTELAALTGLELLYLGNNALTSVPTEIGALAGLEVLNLRDNQLTGVPTEFRTWGPSFICVLSGNPGFSCANVGAGTSCCIADNNCGEGLSGGPCYTG